MGGGEARVGCGGFLSGRRLESYAGVAGDLGRVGGGDFVDFGDCWFGRLGEVVFRGLAVR